jgi:3-oxoadipate enol-lactonase
MVHTAVSIQVGFMKTVACGDIRGAVPKIDYPTLVITGQGSGLASVGETQAWRQIIPNSEQLVLPGNSYHAAASHTVECAQATSTFIERRALGD